ATNGVQMATKGTSSAPNPLTLGLVAGITAIVLIGLSTFLQVGLLRMSLQAARGEKVNFSLLFSGADRFWASLGLMILQTVLVLVGCAALLVPGLFVYLALSFSNFYVVDARMGPIDAMKSSLEIVKTQ